LITRCTRDAATSLDVQLGNVAALGFSANGNEIISAHDNGSILRYSVVPSFKVLQYSMIADISTHTVYSAHDQYIAAVTPENEIRIWRAHYNGTCEQYTLLAGYKKNTTTVRTITTIQFNTITAAVSGEERVILLVVHSDAQHIHLHTYDILTQQEIREPVTLAHNRTSGILVG
jgi:hypothetical protein